VHKVTRSKKVAFVIASTVIGGHEFQSRALVDDFVRYAEVTVYLNGEEQLPVFTGADADIHLQPGLFLESGWLGKQVLNGLRRRHNIGALLRGYDHIVVCAGTVEAGICTSVALVGRRNVTLYLPFFYDRTASWGQIGCVYNLLLGSFGFLYKNIITINRIQAKLIRRFMHRATIVIPNRVNDVPQAEKRRRGRMLYIGRLDRQKRVPELLQWVDFPDNPYCEILVIGEGPERNRIASMVDRMQYVKATLLGWKSAAEQNALIDGNDVLIMNSLIEGEPLVVREAYARGISVITRDIAGFRGITTRRDRYRTKPELRAILAGRINAPKAIQSPFRSRDRFIDSAMNLF